MQVPKTQFDESLSAAAVSTGPAVGGFAEGTEILTSQGPVPVPNLGTGDAVYALDPTTRLVKLKPVRTIQQYETEELIEIRTRRADLRVVPSHPLVYRTKAIDRPRFTQASELDEREHYQFINQWRRPPRDPRAEIDITDLTDEYQACMTTTEHGHTFRASLPDGCEPVYRSRSVGYCFNATTFERFQSRLESRGESVAVRAKRGHRSQPYRFDADEFVRFLGWFVSEGSIHRSSDRETREIQIAQEKPEHRENIRTLLDGLGFDYSADSRSFSFGSYLYGRVLEELCGRRSVDRRLPEFVWDLSRDQQRLLLGVLLNGDGNKQGTYYTSSDQLAGDVLRLCLEAGIKPRYSCRRGTWRVFVNAANDGFASSEHVSRIGESSRVFRLTLEDYPGVMAGRNGRFQ